MLLIKGLDRARAARLSRLAAECRPLLEQEDGMHAVQHRLAERQVEVMDSIIVTMDLLGGGAGALGAAKEAVLSRPARAAEREHHQRLVSDLLEIVDEIGDAERT